MIQRIVKRIQTAFLKRKFKNRTPEEVFTEIYKKNYWGDSESVSGEGSNSEQTRVVQERLRSVIEKFNIKTMIDIPCGDFYWMKDVDLQGVQYVGADIVEDLIEQNTKTFTNASVRFEKHDLIQDRLTAYDLVFVRDCLVHFSYENIYAALKNIKNSGSKYLLTTTFTNLSANKDIVTGDWRPLNLEQVPFLLPKPIEILNEACGEDGGRYSDKSLALWSIESIPDFVTE